MGGGRKTGEGEGGGSGILSREYFEATTNPVVTGIGAREWTGPWGVCVCVWGGGSAPRRWSGGVQYIAACTSAHVAGNQGKQLMNSSGTANLVSARAYSEPSGFRVCLVPVSRRGARAK